MIADNKSSRLSIHDDPFMIENLKELNLNDDFDFESIGLIDFDFNSFNDAQVKEINSGDENSEWVGLPEFEEGKKDFKLILNFETEEQRQNYIDDNNVPITSKQGIHAWTSRF